MRPQNEQVAFTHHLDAEPTLRRPIAPEPGVPDPAPERTRLERELGISELASSLAAYGTPPVAPPPARADREALERELLQAALADVSRWKVSARRRLGDQVHEQGSRRAQAEDQRLAAEHQQLQRELDARWAQLLGRYARAVHDAEQWLGEEIERREAARVEQQAILDSEWQRMAAADPNSVTESLRAVFTGSTTTALGALEGTAVVIVACPDRDEVIADQELGAIPDKEMALTRAGRRAVKPRSEARRNHLYLAAIASRVLAAVGRCLATTPAVDAVTCVAVRARQSGNRPWEAIYAGTFQRAYAERLLAEGRWSSDPDVLTEAVKQAEAVDLELSGTAHEVAALDLSDDPGLTAVMDRLDAAIRSDENAARSSDQEAVKAFLDYGEPELYADDERREEEPNELHSGMDATAHEPPSGGDSTPAGSMRVAPTDEEPAREDSMHEESMHERPRDRSAPGAGTAGEGRGGDLLPEALNDSDPSVRRAAVEAISRRNDPSDTPLLLEALKDRDHVVRLEAIYAVKDRLTPDMRRHALIEACADVDESVRRKAFEALAELGDERDTPLLLGALKDPDSVVRLEAIYAIKDRLAPEMREPLVEACGDVDDSVRRNALDALAELGDERDTPLLLKALTDRDDNARLEAIYAVKDRLTPDMRRHALIEACADADERVRRNAFEVLAQFRDEHDTPLLLGALRDSDAGVRLEAIYALKDRLASHMRQALIGACGDLDQSVRRKALEVLAELDDERDTPLLLKALKDRGDNVRLEAIYALQNRSMGGASERLSEPLLEAMSDKDASVRQAAVRLFGRLEQPKSSGRATTAAAKTRGGLDSETQGPATATPRQGAPSASS